uniref:Uncharacterized protein n=1 Tax=Globodera rostochiensis TaxID=31243 RepID=A0A914GX60_GLORO
MHLTRFCSLYSNCDHRRVFRSSKCHPHAASTSLLLRLSLLLAFSLIVSPARAFILQELPLYRNIRNQRLSPANRPSNGLHNGGGAATFLLRSSRAFNFHRMNRLQDFWRHRSETLKRLAQAQDAAAVLWK